ncbi:MAG: hypothetical protein M3O61_12560 [Gemmatimonadota bacterium]|nr:hypothetical protein [Gemmatimonadota bacterium]
MEPVLIDRRAFVTAATTAVLLLLLPGCTGDVGLDEQQRRRLSRMARLLYPHDALPDATYDAVLESLQRRANQDPALAAALRDGLRQLDRAADGDWRNAPPHVQIQALRTLETGAFFDTVRQAVTAELYERPEVWRLIGYEGPSAPLGGYLHRGFNDIDWLPRESA